MTVSYSCYCSGIMIWLHAGFVIKCSTTEKIVSIAKTETVFTSNTCVKKSLGCWSFLNKDIQLLVYYVLV